MAEIEPDMIEVEVNIISVTSHILGFNDAGQGQAPLPAPDTRSADVLMINWIATNVSEYDLTWTFANELFYEWKLLLKTEDGYDEVFHYQQAAAENDYETAIEAREGQFGIPPTGDVDNPDAMMEEDVPPNLEEPPSIPLANLIAEHEIPKDADLCVWFKVLESKFQHESIYPLWREPD